MIKLTMREFRARLKHYFDIMAGGENLNISGITIGIVRERVHAPKSDDMGITQAENPTSEPKIEAKNVYTKNPKTCTQQERLEIARAALAQALAKNGRGHTTPDQENIDQILCDKCKRSAEDLKPTWEDGEEFNVCKSCRIKSGLKR